jgi:hypothetical protein
MAAGRGCRVNAAFRNQPERNGTLHLCGSSSLLKKPDVRPGRKIVTNALDPATQTPLDGAAAMILADVRSDFLVWHLVATKPELREYKGVYVLSDAEIGLFSDEVRANCAP